MIVCIMMLMGAKKGRIWGNLFGYKVSCVIKYLVIIVDENLFINLLMNLKFANKVICK